MLLYFRSEVPSGLQCFSLIPRKGPEYYKRPIFHSTFLDLNYVELQERCLLENGKFGAGGGISTPHTQLNESLRDSGGMQRFVRFCCYGLKL